MTEKERKFILRAMEKYDKKHKTDYAHVFSQTIIAPERIETKRFQIIGRKFIKCGIIKFYNLGAFDTFSGAVAQAKQNVREAYYLNQFIFDNNNGYCVKIDSKGDEI